MIQIINTEVFGLDRAIKASGNSFTVRPINTLQLTTDKDLKRASALGSSVEPHQSHDSFLKGILVQFDVRYPQYWSMEAQRYHYFEIIMSSSKMHRLANLAVKPLDEFRNQFNKYVDEDIIKKIQEYADAYMKEEDKDKKYECFMRLVSNLPMGYELEMTISTNYLQLKTMFIQRKNHKLREDWGEFCKWCLSLPKFTELTGCSL